MKETFRLQRYNKNFIYPNFLHIFLEFSKKSCIFAAETNKQKNMNNEQMRQKLREIVNKSARSLTDEDKIALTAIGEELGVERGGKSGCQKCWHEFAIQCWKKIAEEETEAETDTERAYVLHDGVDVLFGSIRVNAATLTDELAEQIIARGFDRKFFTKCK